MGFASLPQRAGISQISCSQTAWIRSRRWQSRIRLGPLSLPPQFRDLNGLAMWLAYSNFFNRVHLDKVQAYYQDKLNLAA